MNIDTTLDCCGTVSVKSSERMHGLFENTVNLSMLSTVTTLFLTKSLANTLEGSKTVERLGKVSSILGQAASGIWFVDNINTAFWWIKGKREGKLHTAGKVAMTTRQLIDGLEFLGVKLDAMCGTIGAIPVLGTVVASLRVFGATCNLIHKGMQLNECRVAKKDLAALQALDGDRPDVDVRINEFVTKHLKAEADYAQVLLQTREIKMIKLEEFLQKKVAKEKDLIVQIIENINLLAWGILVLVSVFYLRLQGTPVNWIGFYTFGFMTVNFVRGLVKPKPAADSIQN